MSFRTAASTVSRSIGACARPLSLRSVSPTATAAVRCSVRPGNQTRSLHASSSNLKKQKDNGGGGGGGGKKRGNFDPREPEDVDEEKKAVEDKTRAKMSKSFEWVGGMAFEAVERTRGGVSPALLDGVKLQLPGETAMTPLKAIASITSRQHTLWIESYDKKTTKLIESAIASANLPGLSPQRVDETTVKIPISRPTAETRAAMLKKLMADIETARNQVRLARTDGAKALGGTKDERSEDVRKMADEFGVKLDELAKQAKSEFAKA